MWIFEKFCYLCGDDASSVAFINANETSRGLNLWGSFLLYLTITDNSLTIIQKEKSQLPHYEEVDSSSDGA